jgi:hypothetical protein
MQEQGKPKTLCQILKKQQGVFISHNKVQEEVTQASFW